MKTPTTVTKTPEELHYQRVFKKFKTQRLLVAEMTKVYNVVSLAGYFPSAEGLVVKPLLAYANFQIDFATSYALIQRIYRPPLDMMVSGESLRLFFKPQLFLDVKKERNQFNFSIELLSSVTLANPTLVEFMATQQFKPVQRWYQREYTTYEEIDQLLLTLKPYKISMVKQHFYDEMFYVMDGILLTLIKRFKTVELRAFG